MKIIVPGHRYRVPNVEDLWNSIEQTIQFIHKKPDPNNEGFLITEVNGTTNEAILEVLIDRMQFLQKSFPCRENAIVITKLEESLMWLEKRTTDRLKRQVEGKHIA